MENPIRRLLLGVGAVAVVAALCFVAVWSVRGRLTVPAQTAHVQQTQPSAVAVDEAKIAALEAEVARLQSERDDALARLHDLQAQAAAASPALAETRPAEPQQHHHVQAPADHDGFGEPETFSSISTAQY